jgi:transcriptional regulator with XRE-family HTH domain
MGNGPRDRADRTLQDRIREAADDMGQKFSRVALRQAAGVTKASVSDWFTGKTGALKGETLVKAAAYLGVTPAWLGNGEGPKRRPSIFAETDDEAELLTLFRKMDDQQRAATLGVAKIGRVISNPVDPKLPPAPPLPARFRGDDSRIVYGSRKR